MQGGGSKHKAVAAAADAFIGGRYDTLIGGRYEARLTGGSGSRGGAAALRTRRGTPPRSAREVGRRWGRWPCWPGRRLMRRRPLRETQDPPPLPFSEGGQHGTCQTANFSAAAERARILTLYKGLYHG